jgi:hypothetical protein
MNRRRRLPREPVPLAGRSRRIARPNIARDAKVPLTQ